MGAEQNGDCWNPSNRVNKNGDMSVKNLAGTMIHFADYISCWYLLGYPNTRIQIQHFSSNTFTEIGNEVDILYPGIRITEEI
jgi:hypothetical protein